MTAAELARRTADFGYPITRGAIAKIESNARSGKLDLAEWLILSMALDIPPVLLLFPTYPMGDTEVAPGKEMEAAVAAYWLAGRLLQIHGGAYEPAEGERVEGMQLVRAFEDRVDVQDQLLKVMEMAEAPGADPGLTDRLRENLLQRYREVNISMGRAAEQLWNWDFHSDDSEDDSDQGDDDA